MRIKGLFIIALSIIFVFCKSDNFNSDQQKTKNTEANQVKNAKILNDKALVDAGKKERSEASAINWLSIEEAQKIDNSEGKKFLVDVYTDWCGWCKVMEKKTFSDPETLSYLEKNFHLVKLNAEQKEDIVFKGKKYEWVKSGRKGVNSLAKELLGSKMRYPTIVYLDKDMNMIKSIGGFKDPTMLMADIKSL